MDWLEAEEAAEASKNSEPDFVTIHGDDNGPLDRLAKTAEWEDILVYGALWETAKPQDRETLKAFKRPGGTYDISAKVLKANPHVLVVHSDAAGLPSGKGQKLTKGRVYAHLNYSGDQSAAAKALVKGEAVNLPAHVVDAVRSRDNIAGSVTEVTANQISGDKPTPAGPAEQRSYIDLLADDEYRKMKARELAKQRLIQESAVGITLPEFYPLDEFLATPDTETPYLVNEIWPKGGHILIVAQQKAGKTTLRNNLAKSLCDGYDFLNRFQIFRPEGRIVILDLELPENMLRRWMRDCGIRNQQQLVVVPMRGKAASLNLGLSEVRAKWAQKLKELEASCVLLDCLRPVLDALNMSEDKDASKFLGHFDALLVEAGVPDAAVIHHAGHGSDRARGDSGILGWSDATWGLSLEDPQDQASPRYFKAYGRIDRDIPDAKLDYDPLTRKLAWVGGTKTDAKAKAAMPHVVTFLRANPATEQNPAPSQTAIQKALKTDLDIGYPVTKRAIALLEREGTVLVSEGKSGTRSAHNLTELAGENYPPPAGTESTDQPISDRLATASNRSDRGPIDRLTATSSGIGNRSADEEVNGS
jgi:AAA domain